jgi:hypothetical protein
MQIAATSVALGILTHAKGGAVCCYAMLSEQEKLQRDIRGLTESIRLGWAEVGSKPMRPKDRRELGRHIAGLVTELGRLLGLLD